MIPVVHRERREGKGGRRGRSLFRNRQSSKRPSLLLQEMGRPKHTEM